MKGMQEKGVAIGALIGGIGSILAGLAGLITHAMSGDIATNWQTSFTALTAGLAIFSPGLNALKVGVFERPAKIALPVKQ